ncbi:MAG TPA: hypothetical protein VNG31_04460, partial [Candidatus Baltobacteraceae bacterium]|nr:hypothetical protein [Candidatus Baltobacteraceae bacterium]
MTLPGRPSDLRDHPKFKEVWELFCRVHEPALGRLRHATQLAPSPDGRSIVFAGNVQQRLDDVSQERLGIVDLSDGIARNLDTATGSASRPAWSRDGVLAYVSQGTHVVCGDRAIDVPAGGIAEEIAWSRDAQRLLVRLAGKGADAPGAAGSGSLTSDAGRAATWLPYVEGAFADDAWRRASVVDVRNGRTLWSSPPGDNVWEAVWCGDFGVVAVVSDDPTESSWYRSRLVYYDTQSAQRRELYRGMEEMGVPAASPDGRYVTVVEACCSDRMLVAGNLTLLDLERKPLRPQTLDALGIDVTHAVWRDAHRLLFAGLDRMDTVVGEYDVRSDRSHEIWRSGESVGAYSPVVWTV